MALSSKEKSELLNSLEKIKKEKIDLWATFYDIFLKNEEIAPLFKNVPMETQKKMFNVSLESIIFFMDKPNQVKIELKDMGIRHKRYGLKPYHIPYFKTSFLEALKKSSNNGLNDEILALWGKVIDLIVESLAQQIHV